MTAPLEWALLVGVATFSGGLNAVAGGGSFFTFPALLFAGVPAIPANATNTVALWPASLSSAYGFREDMKHERRELLILGAISVAGGLVGALLLLLTPERQFRALVPWLLLAATLIFALGPAITRRVRARRAALPLAAVCAAQLVIAIYGGYFGGGIGILMLAAMSAMGLSDLHAMNGLKAILGAAINGVAIVAFVVAGIVVWPLALAMAAGAIVGGYAAARLSRKADTRALRWLIIGVGAAMTAYFFARGA